MIGVLKKIWDFAGEEQGNIRKSMILGFFYAVFHMFQIAAIYVVVLALVGGVGPFADMVHNIDNPEGIHFFSLIARGAGEDIGAGLSLVLGVLTTQTYAQAVLSGKTDGAARRGALLSAFLIPPIGVGGILVGLYMRANAALYPGLTAKTALTTFVTAEMPPVLAGVILGTLFIAVVGTGAGLALGISSILNNDIVKRVTHKFDDPKKESWLSKVWIVVVLAVACCMSTGSLGDTILQFAFMSMGLRGAVVFLPLCAALWLGLLLLFSLNTNNRLYTASAQAHRATLSYATRLLSRIESCPGYTHGMPVYLIGSFPTDRVHNSVEGFAQVDHYSVPMDTVAPLNKHIYYYLRDWLNLPIEEPAEADLMAMAERPEFAAMPRYPDDGSVQIIDGCLVVKVQEEYTPKSDFEIAYENRR